MVFLEIVVVTKDGKRHHFKNIKNEASVIVDGVLFIHEKSEDNGKDRLLTNAFPLANVLRYEALKE